MKCSKCGAELSDDTRFCSYCGNKIEVRIEQENIVEEGISPVRSDEPTVGSQNQKEEPQSSGKKKSKIFSKWSKLSTYGKISTVAIAVFIMLFIVALLSGKTAAIVIAVFQIALVVAALLMHKGVIRLEQKKFWLKWLLLGIAALLSILNIVSYSWGSNVKIKHDYDTNSASSATSVSVVSVTAPCGADECSEQDCYTVLEAFSSGGFTNIVIEPIEDLQAADVDRLNTIDSISVDGQADFTKGQEFKSDNEVLIRYHVYAKCSVKIHIDFIPNLVFSKYDVDLLFNGTEEGTLTHGEDKDFTFSVDPGEYTLTFESAESSSVKGEVTLTVDSDLEASYQISCSSDKISVEKQYIDRMKELAEGEVKLDVSAEEYIGENYEDVTTALETLGFNNINYRILYDIVLGWTDEGDVKSVSIRGTTDFKRGDVFPADAKIVITYHMPEDDDPDKPDEKQSAGNENNSVSYSTNSYETAKQGNTGVYSYKSAGDAYDIYWIIDFDEGYVYWFTDAAGETSCDRLKIESGTLNDTLTITYHDGDDEWSYYLHFKYVSQPDTLIMVDNDGFVCEYSATNLNNASKIRNGKTVTDY